MEPSTLPQLDFSQLLGLSEMSDAERDEMLSNIGSLILESVLLRAVATMTEDETNQFTEFVAQDPNPEALLNEMRRVIPDIDTLVAEETEAFKEECARVFARQNQLATV
jgi:hypothetical protein